MPSKIRVAIAGVGNATAALVQGAQYYSDDPSRTGLWHQKVGGHSISDIEIVAAYDIDSRKVGSDLSKAIFARPNVMPKYINLRPLGVDVEAGILGNAKHLQAGGVKTITRNGSIADSLKRKKADILLNLISSGNDAASKEYAEAAVSAQCSFVNATPTKLINDNKIVPKYIDAGVIIVGDDLMSQFGGTAFHRGILDIMNSRGIRVKKSYQLDVGGGMETLNTLGEDLRAVKRNVKTEAIALEVPYNIESVAGTTDYVDFMGNSRTSYYWIEGEQFLGSSVRFDIYLRTTDGPNGAGVLVDIVRAIKAARDKEHKGLESTICAFGFKSPPKRQKLSQAYEEFRQKYVH
ncbi:MAG: inositol-3-phosphate synthase [Thaumarchaeota archaeon]|nr:inositol-3-phosphate synthase [Nitrososphaerota archaeon]